MKKAFIRRTFVFLSIFLIFFTINSSPAHAGIVSCGDKTNNPCTLCHLIVGIHDIMTYGMQILLYLSIVAIVISGIMYVISSGDPGMITKAKGILVNTLIGFSLVLLAWLIVSLVLWLFSAQGGTPDYNLGITGKTWNKFECSTESAATNTTVPGQGGKTATAVETLDCSGITMQTTKILAQCNKAGEVSPAIMSTLSCISNELGAGNFQVSSLTDNNGANAGTLYSNTACSTDAQTNCRHHAATSCHYGGTGACKGTSYAADISVTTSKASSSKIKDAATKCGAKIKDETNHIHVSVGAANGCGCDTGLK